MDGSTFYFLGLRVFVSCMGFLGNVFLFLSIFQTKFSHIKSFELFLMGLAAANLEEIVIINFYDIIILETSSTASGIWLCDLLLFMTVFSEICSIFFTVIISIFRYQKLRDVTKRANLPIYLDNIKSARILSGICVMMSLLIGTPVFFINPQGSAENITGTASSCPRDFFHCDTNYCPQLHSVYKYLFILVCHLLPLVIVTVTSCLIVMVLLSQRKMVTPEVSGSPSSQLNKKSPDLRLNRSTVAIVAAMGLFQVDWTIYLIFQFFFSSNKFPFVAEAEFFISTSYTSISPYVYGMGQNLFSFKNLKKLFKSFF